MQLDAPFSWPEIQTLLFTLFFMFVRLVVYGGMGRGITSSLQRTGVDLVPIGFSFFIKAATMPTSRLCTSTGSAIDFILIAFAFVVAYLATVVPYVHTCEPKIPRSGLYRSEGTCLLASVWGYVIGGGSLYVGLSLCTVA